MFCFVFLLFPALTIIGCSSNEADRQTFCLFKSSFFSSGVIPAVYFFSPRFLLRPYDVTLASNLWDQLKVFFRNHLFYSKSSYFQFIILVLCQMIQFSEQFNFPLIFYSPMFFVIELELLLHQLFGRRPSSIIIAK